MSYLQTRLSQGFNKLIDRAGTPIRVQYFTQAIGSVWDDDASLTQSGTDLWTSGIHLPLNNSQLGDAALIEQGKLIQNDSKLFLHGSLLLVGSEYTIKINVGSPGTSYMPIIPGPVSYSVSSTPIYKKLFIREIGGTGSIFGE
jgi:hypothetical protein